MTDQQFREPPRFTIYGIDEQGVGHRVTGAPTKQKAKDEIWNISKSYPTWTWRVFEAQWLEVDISE